MLLDIIRMCPKCKRIRRFIVSESALLICMECKTAMADVVQSNVTVAAPFAGVPGEVYLTGIRFDRGKTK